MSAPIVFIDTETTSLRHDRRAWEVGLILRRPGRPDVEHSWLIDADHLDLGNADLRSLEVGRFHERHPMYRLGDPAPLEAMDEIDVMLAIEACTRGAHLAGAVVNFDAEVIGNQMRQNGICPSWHYHLIDVEALAVGFLNGRRHRQNEIVDGYPGENDGAEAPGLVRWNDRGCEAVLPWDSRELSRAVGVNPEDFDRHTALGDARWARAIYDAITGGA